MRDEERLNAEQANKELRETPLSAQRIYEGKIVTLECWQVRLPNGQNAPREVILHGGACAVVPVDDDGFVTLVRQHRVAVDKVTTEIPAGKLDRPDEDPLCCAKRELEEEAGLRARDWRELTCLLTTPAFCKERIYIYLATGLEKVNAHLDEDEFLHVLRMPLTKAVELVMDGVICDAKTCAGLLMAERVLRG